MMKNARAEAAAAEREKKLKAKQKVKDKVRTEKERAAAEREARIRADQEAALAAAKERDEAELSERSALFEIKCLGAFHCHPEFSSRALQDVSPLLIAQMHFEMATCMSVGTLQLLVPVHGRCTSCAMQSSL